MFNWMAAVGKVAISVLVVATVAAVAVIATVAAVVVVTVVVAAAVDDATPSLWRIRFQFICGMLC